MKQFLRILFFIIISCGGISSKAQTADGLVSYGQQDPQFTQYMFNPMMFNPAVAGSETNWVSTLAVRNQWVGIPGAPVSQSFTSHLPLYKLSGGAGISVMNDIAGQQRNTIVTLAYAWHKNFRKSLLSFGLNGGIVQHNLDGSKLITPTGNYENIVDHNDPNLPVTLQSKVLPDAGAGVWYLSEKITAGISATHVLLPLWKAQDVTGNNIQYNPNAYVYLAYHQKLGSLFELMPNVLYKTDLSESMVDLNLICTFKDNFLLGASFRSNVSGQSDAIAMVAGLNISEKWKVSYSYDITTSALNAVSSGSHEVLLSYRLKMDKPRSGKMINNPRFIYH